MSRPVDSRWEKISRYVATGVAVIALGAAAWGLLWYWPQQAAEDLNLPKNFTQEELRHQVEIQQLENARREMGAQLLLALAVLAGVWLTFKRVRTMERQAQSAQDQVELARRQQTAERFTQAIEQLGSGELSIRLGGIYALEKIARDEPEAYFSLFREVLCAFVRGRAREPHVDEEGKFLPLPTDLQAALTVLGRYSPPDEIENPARIDWSKSYLGRANLYVADLAGADLFGVHLEGANLLRAHLEDAVLHSAHLESAILRKAHLEGAILASARLERADLFEAHLTGADLYGAHLEGAELGCAQLQRAKLIKAYLSGAMLPAAHLEDAELAGAFLEGAELHGAHLGGTELIAAHLEGARLLATHLEGARHLDKTHLRGALYDHRTDFPEGFQPPDDMIYAGPNPNSRSEATPTEDTGDS